MYDFASVLSGCSVVSKGFVAVCTIVTMREVCFGQRFVNNVARPPGGSLSDLQQIVGRLLNPDEGPLSARPRDRTACEQDLDFDRARERTRCDSHIVTIRAARH